MYLYMHVCLNPFVFVYVCTYVFMYVCMLAFVCLGEWKNGFLASQSSDAIRNFANQKGHVNLDH